MCAAPAAFLSLAFMASHYGAGDAFRQSPGPGKGDFS
jgi:hypothetical protein